MFAAHRYHDISCGHRVYGHESKCANLHGHNYRIHFYCRAIDKSVKVLSEWSTAILPSPREELDSVGRVVDFSVIKEKLCMWVETMWDHKFLIYHKDPLAEPLSVLDEKVFVTLFNPTAENIARYLVDVVGPKELAGLGIQLYKCVVEETAKCTASYEV